MIIGRATASLDRGGAPSMVSILKRAADVALFIYSRRLVFLPIGVSRCIMLTSSTQQSSQVSVPGRSVGTTPHLARFRQRDFIDEFMRAHRIAVHYTASSGGSHQHRSLLRGMAVEVNRLHARFGVLLCVPRNCRAQWTGAVTLRFGHLCRVEGETIPRDDFGRS